VTQGISLTTLALNLMRGTIAAQRASVEQVPTPWLTVEGDSPPQIGDTVRVVNGRESANKGGHSAIRVDKTLTAVWRLARDLDAH